MAWTNLVKKLYVLYRKKGGRAVREAFVRRLTGGTWAAHDVEDRANDLRLCVTYPSTLPLKPPQAELVMESLDLHWVITDFFPGAGGHTTLFRIAYHLECFGHRNTFWIFPKTRYETPDRALGVIQEHFFPLAGPVRVLRDPNEVQGDAVIATERWTSYPVRAVQAVRQRYYFVQDFEPMFSPPGSEYLLTEQTYRFGFRCITAGRWLETLLERDYGIAARSFELAVDREVYFDQGSTRAPKSVAFYARHTTPRRAVELGLLALELVAKRHPDLHVHLFGCDPGRFDLPFDYTNHGMLSLEELATLYNTTTVGLALSATNYTLVSQEMLACGLPIVDLDGENTRLSYPPGAVMLAAPNPVSIAEALDELISQGTTWSQYQAAGLQYVAGLSWEGSARRVESAIQDGLVVD